MKRVVITGNILTTQKFGGVSRYLIELAMGISQSPEWSVRLGALLYINEYLFNNRSVLGHRGLHLSKYRRGLIDMNESLVTLAFRDWLANSDVIHETNYNFTRLKRRSRGRVSTFYDMMSESLAPNAVVKHKKSKTAEHSDRIIAISESTKRDIVRHFGTSPEKIEVIHLASSIRPVSERLAVVPDQSFLLWVGARMGYKNFGMFVKALSRSKEFFKDRVLVCAGGPPLTDAEKQSLSQSGIELDRVVHCRPDEAELACLYSHAECLVYPSKYEGFGLPPLEAMTCSCPVIASDCTSIPEITGDAALLVDPDEPDDLAEAIDRVCGNTGTRGELVSRGTKRAAQFSWQRCIESHLSLYESLA